jgi:glycine cleavage system H protein
VLELDHCVFPDELLYDVENNTWLRVGEGITVTIGVTSLLSTIAGKLIRAKLKPIDTMIERGQSLGTLESEKFVGPIPSPVSGTVFASNENVLIRPKTINDSPYDKGWIIQLSPKRLTEERKGLASANDSRVLFAQKIAQLRARCFKAFPDYEMFEIGTECSAVLVRLGDQIKAMPTGEVVHLVSDDPTAYIEMVAWADRMGQSLVDWRKEGNLYHFIVRKTK